MAKKTNKLQNAPKPSLAKKGTVASNLVFPIVGIGTSAGGLEALELFFTEMPSDSGMAFVVVQHLDPNYIGMLPELIQRFTSMKVFQATDAQKVTPNCVYVIPPNKSLSILKMKLYLLDPVESRGLRLPIDIFFRSLAHDQKERSIGIILSGMGSDGALGLKAIKEVGGLVLVQDPDTAKFDAMPKNAIKAALPDIIEAIPLLPSKLIALLNFTATKKTFSEIDTKTKQELDKVIILIREQTGHDFSLYKKNTLLRRIERRKGVHQINSTKDYIRFLQENPKETEILFKELLIGVTSFFRDKDVWNKLKDSVLPDLLKTLPNGYVLRAWVPACSTGEEAFSLAMVFQEVIDKFKTTKKITLQIFATDLDSEAINSARKGIYMSNIIADVSPVRLKRFFVKDGSHYKVNSSIREMVVFALHDVTKNPPFIKLDILTCRNLLIYMEPLQQQKLITLFNYSLNPGGIMILGTAETRGSTSQGFVEVDSKLKIYRRTTEHSQPELIAFAKPFYNKDIMTTDRISTATENFQQLTDQILLQQFTPASVLVNKKGDILYITGRTGKYLEPVAGKANWNIYAMAHEGLREELPGAFRKVIKDFEPVVLDNVKIGNGRSKIIATVTLQRLEKPKAVQDLILIVFKEVSPDKNRTPEPKRKGKNQSMELEELEMELHRVKEILKNTQEEMQISSEEFKSINEELQSTNEELQSTNEELTTSKEEMQSLNEELQTVNTELQSKISDLELVNNDMKNLLNSTEIATLFLDKELNIRRYTDSVIGIFKLRDTDIGRPFTDLGNDLKYPEIENHAKHVLKTLQPIETSIATTKGTWFSIRIMPYRTMDDRIGGLVITFTDVTELMKLRDRVKENRE